MESQNYKSSHYQVRVGKIRRKRPSRATKSGDFSEERQVYQRRRPRASKYEDLDNHHYQRKHTYAPYYKKKGRNGDYYDDGRVRRNENRKGKRRDSDREKRGKNQEMRVKRWSRCEKKGKYQKSHFQDYRDREHQKTPKYQNRPRGRRHTYAVGLRKDTLDEILPQKEALKKMQKLQKVFKSQNERKRVNSERDNKIENETVLDTSNHVESEKQIKKGDLILDSDCESGSDNEFEPFNSEQIDLFGDLSPLKNKKTAQVKLVVDLSELRKKNDISGNTTQGSINESTSLSKSSSMPSISAVDEDYQYLLNALKHSKIQILKLKESQSIDERPLPETDSIKSLLTNDQKLFSLPTSDLDIDSEAEQSFETLFRLQNKKIELNSSHDGFDSLDLNLDISRNLNEENEILKLDSQNPDSNLKAFDLDLMLAKREVEEFEIEESEFMTKISPILEDIDKDRKKRRETMNQMFKQKTSQMINYYSLMAQREEYNFQVDKLLKGNEDSNQIPVEKPEFRIKSQFDMENIDYANLQTKSPTNTENSENIGPNNGQSDQNSTSKKEEANQKSKTESSQNEKEKPKKMIVLKKCKKFFSQGTCPRGPSCKNLHIKDYKKYQNLLLSVNNHVISRFKKGDTSLSEIMNCFDKLHPSLQIFSKFMYRKPEISVFDEMFLSDVDQDRIV